MKTPSLPSAAVNRLLEEFSWNPWFIKSYWPENQPRLAVMSGLAHEKLPQDQTRRALEIGCGNGYVAYLFHLLGYQVSAVDASRDEKRDELFSGNGIAYRQVNLNERDPLSAFPPGSFDLILLGEVFEHILNQPAELLRATYRLLRPGGVLLLTTPNPSTLMNAARLLADRYVLWGTGEFLREAKISDGKVIDRGEIHYREYPAWLVRELLEEIGFEAEEPLYVSAGVAPAHPPLKRLVKRSFSLLRLSRLRMLACGYVICARKPGPVR